MNASARTCSPFSGATRAKYPTRKNPGLAPVPRLEARDVDAERHDGDPRRGNRQVPRHEPA